MQSFDVICESIKRISDIFYFLTGAWLNGAIDESRRKEGIVNGATASKVKKSSDNDNEF